MRIWTALLCLLAAAPALGASAPPASRSAIQPTSPSEFSVAVQPFLRRHCLGCHNARLKNGGLDFGAYPDAVAALTARPAFERVLDKLKAGEMPPPPIPHPDPKQTAAFTAWFEREFAAMDRRTPVDPGRVTARRLNRAEYDNTIRDLLGADFQMSVNFPADDSGYGFDNNGDVLSLSPVLLEKYLNAAERLSRYVVLSGPPPKATAERYKRERLEHATPREIQFRHVFKYEGEYELRLGLGGSLPVKEGNPESLTICLEMDGRMVSPFTVPTAPDTRRTFSARIPVGLGSHTLRAHFVDPAYQPRTRPGDAERPLLLDHLEIVGPFFRDGKVPVSEAQQRLFVCDQQSAACGRRIVAEFARRAWRRPVSPAEVERLASLIARAQKDGGTFEQGLRLAMQAVLVSPHFLFRIEREPRQRGAVHALSDFELASRLSYFLWSSMPDERLFQLARANTLHQPAILRSEVERMLASPKSVALVDNFAGQWLQLRNLDSAKPDPDRFPDFDEPLRQAMRTETRMFFDAILRENRSLNDFLEARFTFLNARLAKHYGIPGVEGEPFRRVHLETGARGGLLGQAAILTVSSYPTRTSPVIRGKWILENVLGTPPPPPPADVPALDEQGVGTAQSLRKRLEAHRANPVCASCHSRMDPLGFSLENYDAIGRWRMADGKFPIDPSGVLPSGRKFAGPAELRQVLASNPEALARCLAEKLLVYATGRGLEPADRRIVKEIVSATAARQYRFRELIQQVVASPAFLLRRAERSAEWSPTAP